MFNLLPEKEQKKLRREYLMRLLAVLLFGMFLVFAAGAATLIPSFAWLQVENNKLAVELAELEQLIEAGGGNEANEFLEETDLKTQLMEVVAKKHSAHDVLEDILTAKGSGIRVRSMTFSEETTRSSVQLRGVALSRNDLVAFTEALEQDERIENVQLPLGDLASSRDIPFNLTITLAS